VRILNREEYTAKKFNYKFDYKNEREEHDKIGKNIPVLRPKEHDKIESKHYF